MPPACNWGTRGGGLPSSFAPPPRLSWAPEKPHPVPASALPAWRAPGSPTQPDRSGGARVGGVPFAQVGQALPSRSASPPASRARRFLPPGRARALRLSPRRTHQPGPPRGARPLRGQDHPEPASGGLADRLRDGFRRSGGGGSPSSSLRSGLRALPPASAGWAGGCALMAAPPWGGVRPERRRRRWRLGSSARQARPGLRRATGLVG